MKVDRTEDAVMAAVTIGNLRFKVIQMIWSVAQLQQNAFMAVVDANNDGLLE